MYCKNCGARIADGSTFCSSCGKPVSAEKNNADIKMPAVVNELINRLRKIFTGKEQVSGVIESVNDKTFSGVILAACGILLFALAAMINVNQTASSIFSTSWGVSSGKTFLCALLMGLVTYILISASVFCSVNFIAKKPISIQGALNLVAYSSIPMICSFVLNMFLGIIWFVLPYILIAFSTAMTLMFIYSGVAKTIGSIKSSFLPFSLTAGIAAIVVCLFVCLGGKGIIRDASIGGGIAAKSDDAYTKYVAEFVIDNADRIKKLNEKD